MKLHSLFKLSSFIRKVLTWTHPRMNLKETTKVSVSLMATTYIWMPWHDLLQFNILFPKLSTSNLTVVQFNLNGFTVGFISRRRLKPVKHSSTSWCDLLNVLTSETQIDYSIKQKYLFQISKNHFVQLNYIRTNLLKNRVSLTTSASVHLRSLLTLMTHLI